MDFQLKAFLECFADLCEQVVSLGFVEAMIVSYGKHNFAYLVAFVITILVQAEADVGVDFGGPVTFDFEPTF